MIVQVDRPRHASRHAMLLIAALVTGLVLSTVNIAGASTVTAQSNTQPPAKVSPCGSLMPGQGSRDFPRLDMTKCDQPDTTQVTGRKPWQPIKVGAAVCVDWILYHTNQTGTWNIFRLGEIPGKPKADANISKGSGRGVVDLSPSRSPDGKWVAFTTNRDGNWEIYVAAADGSSLQRVTYNQTAANLAPMWSPDGKYIVYTSTRSGYSNLFQVNVLTGAETRLTEGLVQDRNAVWSPDGKKLAFESNRDNQWQIYELDLTANTVKKLSDGSGEDHNPQYSPDGARIAFRSYRDGRATSAILIMNADGSGAAAISDPNGNAENQAWSSDGALIAYDSDLYGDYDIFVYQPASQMTRRITENKVRDMAPTWRCNGPYVIFSSNITGESSLYQTNALPMNNRSIKPDDINQLTFDDATNLYPMVSPAVEDASLRGHPDRP
jgi:Tol biopolymer transport system component